MFAQAIAEDDERVKQEALEKEEAIKNETSVVTVASTSNTANSQSGNKEQAATQKAATQTETSKPVENATVVTTERETVAAVPAESEYDMLCRIVEAEVTGKDIEAKMMVANVVLNRVESSQFPNTIEGVIFQHRGSVYQFSPVSDGRYYSVTVTDGTREAVNRAMAGEDNSQGALYFVSPIYGNTSWFDRNLNFLFYYGGHNFYK
ncbi:MAG: cell wall hydrolase [Lachnospiraceae bacterium]|nr:cell wall hydrolase [Lachnospiraceae bacterium]